MTDLVSVEAQARRLIADRQFAAAEALIRPHVASGTGPITLWSLLVLALRPQGRMAEVRTIQEMLVDALPGNLSGRFDLAETLLVLGEFRRGWREYHWRYSLPHTTRIERKVQRPRWDGRAIPGQTLLIHDEQGFGDSIQFLRLVPGARARSKARIVLEVAQEVLPLAQRMAGFDAIVARGSLVSDFNVHCELMSLPMVMGLTLEDLPATPIPYLSANPAHVAKWRQRLAGLPRPLVALVWAGRPVHQNDANRSINFADLAPLSMPGVTFLAVQKGPKAEQALTPPPGMNVVSLDSEIEDFEDTAAILEIADLLISVDSSPVHLAGALNRPAWVLLPFVPDWRWLLERSDTPWYPSVKLFRQSAPGDWPGVMVRVSETLRAFRDGVPCA